MNIWVTEGGTELVTELTIHPHTENNLMDTNKQKSASQIRDELEALTQELEMHQTALCKSYDDWIKVGLAIATALPHEGESLFKRISAIGYSKNSEAECSRKWKSLVRSPKSVDLGWLYAHAGSQGVCLRDFWREFFRQHPEWSQSADASPVAPSPVRVRTAVTAAPAADLQLIPAIWPRRCCRPTSSFVKALTDCRIVSQDQALWLTSLYLLGARRDGRVIFWLIDEQQRVRDGKVMLYGADCHRSHQVQTTWMGYLMRTGRDLDPVTGQPILSPDWSHTLCLFGQHLLPSYPQAPICIVEAEKTAVICAARLNSLQCLWLAAGGLGMLRPESMKCMSGRDVILFPDTDPEGETFRRWSNIGVAAQRYTGRTIRVYDGLERMATPQQKERKIDIADFILEAPPHTDDAVLLFPDAIVPSSALATDIVPPASGSAPAPVSEPDLFANPAVSELIDQFGLIDI